MTNTALHGVTPSFIKIDAEGAEYKILRSMQKIMDMHHPKLMIEIHLRHLEKLGVTLGSLFDFIEQYADMIFDWLRKEMSGLFLLKNW